MAKLKHIFSMECSPDDAQAMFVSHIAPEISRSTQIPLLREESGRLTFATVGTGGSITRVVPKRRLWGPHIEVTFESDILGTKVTLRGSCEQSVRAALEQLGSQGHWPETADQPHD